MQSSKHPTHENLPDFLNQLTQDELDVIMQKAIGSGFYTATDTHPRTTASTRTWEEIVKGLRDLLLLKGWVQPEKSDDTYSSIESSDGNYILVVWTGNKHVGIRANGSKVKTKNGKGDGVSGYIDKNADLFEKDLKEATANSKKLIALIFFHDRSAQEIRYEITMPIGVEFKMQKDAPHKKPKVNSFAWRKIYEPVKINSMIPIKPNDEKDVSSGAEFTPDISLDINFKD